MTDADLLAPVDELEEAPSPLEADPALLVPDNDPEEAQNLESAHGYSEEKNLVIYSTDIDAITPRKQKVPRSIVSPLHLKVLVEAYHLHFGEYKKLRKQVTQLIPGKVWKVVYMHYKNTFPDSPFQEETLKDRLRETLKEVKSETFNEDQDGDRLALQNQGMTISLATEGHPSPNVLKRKHNVMEGMAAPVCPAGSASTANGADVLAPTEPSTPPATPGDELPSKAQVMRNQAASFSSMVCRYHSSSNARDRLIEAKLKHIEHKNNMQQIVNLEKALEVGVITDDEFKERVRKILSL